MLESVTRMSWQHSFYIFLLQKSLFKKFKKSGRESNWKYIKWLKKAGAIFIVSPSPPPPPRDQGGNDFCVISQAGEQLLNFKSQGGDTFSGAGDNFWQSSRGGTASSWRIVGISTKCFTLNFTNFAFYLIFF